TKAPPVIITGVPRTGRDPEPRTPVVPSSTTASQPERVRAPERAALRLPEKHELRETPQPQSTPVEAASQRHYVRAEVRPSSEGDPGAIIEGRYAASGGLVRVWDIQGNLLGTEAFNGDNPEHVARKLLRAKRTGFFDPINYPRNHVV